MEVVASAKEAIAFSEKRSRLNPFRRKYTDYESGTIGIFGLGQGVGVTHVSLLLSVYLSQIKGGKVSILEYSGKNDLVHLEEQYVTKKGENLNSFWLGNILCHKSVSQEDIGRLQNASQDYHILDLGCSYGLAWEELLRCDIKIIMGSSAAWHRMDRERFLNQSQSIECWDSWSFIENLADERVRTDNLPMKEYYIGFVPNLLRLSDPVIRTFYQILH